MGKITLGFANASCAHCARLVTRSLQKVDGIVSVEVDRIGQKLLVVFDPGRVSVDAIRSLLEGSGYSTRLLAATVPLARYPSYTAKAV